MSASSPSPSLERAAPFLAASALAGSALGLAEAGWISLSQLPTSLASAVEILLFAGVGYGLGSLVAALVFLFAPRQPIWASLGGGTAVGCAVACSAAVVALSLSRGMGFKQFTLLALGTAVLAVGLLRLTAWLLQKAPFRLSLTRLLALHLAVLAIASLIPFVRHGHSRQRLLAIAGALVAVALAAFLFSAKRSARLAALLNAALLVTLVIWFLVPPDSVASRGNVLFITVDTLRADRLGAYGHENAHTPNLDRLAAGSLLFENASSASPRTGPSHTSLLTGLYPHHHGALSNRDTPTQGLDNVVTRLGENGFSTGAIVSGWTLRSDVCGLDRYFQTYDNDFSQVPWLPEPVTELRLFNLLETWQGRLPRVERPAGATTDMALRWLRRHRTVPFFLWVHYFDPHVPYDPPAEFERLHVTQPIEGFQRNWYQWDATAREQLAQTPAQRDYMNALYDGEISYVDSQIGRLLDELDELGLAGDTITVLTADHGETLDEHEHFFGHDDLYQTSLRVPLLVRRPGAAASARRVKEPVRTVDLAPTLLDLLGIEGLARSDGRSFAPLLADGGGSGAEPSLASLIDGELELYSVTREPFKLIWRAPRWVGSRREGARQELYDLAADPAELNDLAADRPEVVRELQPLVDAQRVAAAPDALSDEDRDNLRALGYLN